MPPPPPPPFQCFKKNQQLKGPFPNVNSCAIFLLYATLVTCFKGWAIPVSVLINFQRFLLKLDPTGFCSSSKQQTLQQQKKKDFWIEFFFLWCDNFYCAKGHTEETSSVKHSWKLVNLKILMRIACLGLSNIEELYRSCNFGFYWWIILNIRHTCCTHKSLHKYFKFSP